MNDWHALAACRAPGTRWQWWFTDARTDPVGAALAVRVCHTCPVRCHCAGAALDILGRGEPVAGTWGGVRLDGATARVAQLQAVAGGAQVL